MIPVIRTRSPELSDSMSASLSGGLTSLNPSAAIVITATPPDPLPGRQREPCALVWSQCHFLVAVRVPRLGGGLCPPSEPPPEKLRRQSRRSNQPGHSVTALWRCACQDSEGGSAPLPNLPPRNCAGKAVARTRLLTASLPCGGARAKTRRGALPPFRTSPREIAPAKPSLEQGCSQRHFLVAVRVPRLGGGLSPPSEPPPEKLRRQSRQSNKTAHSVTTLC